ncbi:root hair defective 3 GTP-binding protein [Dacryopinax primogenitus]|uniref:Root hair defective 3 GTP-binding protein n=1 Tax=Dacryopinax primogenitus (strain DJM 731) TaxID=1858805 RepID=M5FRB0_DACPD|nr:root hair defective 3 GTP-binding protein [Dacryopinax primogenitus]EJT97474.1 root hair defective 3 GTP-binding protein [Dacryopinax primogenitus]
MISDSVQTPSITNGHADASMRVQVIDEDKKFNADLSKWIDKWGLRSAGFDYDVVAVFGSQSTGKSTLLNKLFGTTFDVMDETQRRQTTKGIWMCRADDLPVLVMDVEGTDGRERGEDQDFERKSALFSLASSQILLVNLWEHQIGLYQGANMALLKTVIEVNLSLFGKTDQKTLLLFVIRDHVGATPLTNLSATLTADIERIWASVSKPEGLESRLLTDYFDLEYVGLAHKILMPDKFEADVKSLRTRFTFGPTGFFKERYRRRIPADGVGVYMDSIWEQVSSNKDLDLPTQQELLAQFRCDEISKAALEAFTSRAKEGRRNLEGGKAVANLGGMMRDWKTEALHRFDTEASRYHAGVYKSKREDLTAALHAYLQPLFMAQLKNLHKSSLALFKVQLEEGLRKDGYDFATVVGDARTKSQTAFKEGADEVLIPDADWDYDLELQQLDEDLTSLTALSKSDEMKKMVNSIERTFKREIGEKVDLELGRPGPKMWDTVLTVYSAALQKAEQAYVKKAKSFGSTPDEDAKSLLTLRQRAWRALKVKVDEHTTETLLLSKLRASFEEKFRYDENGVPRVWSKNDDIDGLFRKSRDETVELITVYSRIKPSNPDLLPAFPPEEEFSGIDGNDEPFEFEESLLILSEAKQVDITSKFRREADAYFVEAKRSIVSSIAQIPYWVYGIILLLGWNEAIFVLFHPIYLFTIIMAGAAAYAIFQLNLAGPLFQISRTVTNELQRQAHGRLKEYFADPPASPSGDLRQRRVSPGTEMLEK